MRLPEPQQWQPGQRPKPLSSSRSASSVLERCLHRTQNPRFSNLLPGLLRNFAKGQLIRDHNLCSFLPDHISLS